MNSRIPALNNLGTLPFRLGFSHALPSLFPSCSTIPLGFCVILLWLLTFLHFSFYCNGRRKWNRGADVQRMGMRMISYIWQRIDELRVVPDLKVLSFNVNRLDPAIKRKRRLKTKRQEYSSLIQFKGYNTKCLHRIYWYKHIGKIYVVEENWENICSWAFWPINHKGINHHHIEVWGGERDIGQEIDEGQ